MENRDGRVAQVYKQIAYSKLIKPGQPEVYLLTAKEYSTSSNIRWFKIGSPNTTTSNGDHKFIILMGATGSGKSTLINGMVNFIFGIQWNDPFRFECVREDDSVVRNQAYSQTSSVTAYTIHHHEGMAIPYSITIIDTPGYGDTRGVTRDKEITKMIHQFFMEKDARIDHIHAACFVAASGDSRLTVTQRYVLDSVLSTFGKDFKDNIRLLVTFADTAVPPVIEACRAAHFPMDSPSTGITYSKFNSSVLYVSNEGDAGESFDKLFWDMGHENFQIFFTMLEGMGGRNLRSTRVVIQQRQQIIQALKDIDDELEICFVNIENMEMFMDKIAQHKIETNPCVTVEKTELRKIKEKCENDFVAYNCEHCKITCEMPVRLEKPEDIYVKKQCLWQACKCPVRTHVYQRFIWRIIPVKVEATIEEMKAEYESNYKCKLKSEEIVIKCSEEVRKTKAKVIDLLNQVGASARSLDSMALRSNALTPTDYLSLMRSRVAEEQKPGYLTRLETLTELQGSLLKANESTNEITDSAKSISTILEEPERDNIPPPKPPRCPPKDDFSVLPAEGDNKDQPISFDSEGIQGETTGVADVRIFIESSKKEATAATPLIEKNCDSTDYSCKLEENDGRKNDAGCFRTFLLHVRRVLRFLFSVLCRLANYLYRLICCK